MLQLIDACRIWSVTSNCRVCNYIICWHNGQDLKLFVIAWALLEFCPTTIITWNHLQMCQVIGLNLNKNISNLLVLTRFQTRFFELYSYWYTCALQQLIQGSIVHVPAAWPQQCKYRGEIHTFNFVDYVENCSTVLEHIIMGTIFGEQFGA